ncbi:hypothetical protein RHMOL_Rhmol06G0134300 [Rhododendron molle]|uniref:Uncharacterized protein n=1 Tax=Rhododendron molle TaxID=49168 RepID=A0ACC0NDI0_RHOML|nr:hypothetical protein RHMOL_Rhmol06G0134300 [Rhododendron molle]
MPTLREKEQTESSATSGSKAVGKSGGSGGRIIMQEFAPSFAMSEGRIISINDSVKLEPGLAPTMLRGLALPNDMEKVPQGLQPSLIHASAYLMQAGQAILRASQQVELVVAERGRYIDDLKAEREKSRSYKGSLKTAKAQIVELEKEKEELADKLKKVEREIGQVIRKEKRKMKEVDEKAYQAGYDRAGLEYIRDARSMVNDEIKLKVPIAYRAGYKDGVRAVSEAMQLDLI